MIEDLAARTAEAVARLTADRPTGGRPLGLRSLIASSGSERHEYRIGDDAAVDVRSISKVAVAAAVGVAIDRGERLGTVELSLRTPVAELFEQAPAGLPRPVGWAGVRVGHLLNGTIGHDEGFLFRRDIGGRDPAGLLDYAIGRPLRHPPGTHFAYSNVGPFVLSVLVQELTGQRLTEWVAARVLAPLGLPTPPWRRYGRYDAGGTGLRLRPRELHALADLFRGGGAVDGRPVLSTGWLAAMTSPSVPTPGRTGPGEILPKVGYGYGMWSCGDGRYFCDGTDGQYLIVDPRQDLAVSTLADEPDMAALRSGLAPLLRSPGLPRPGVSGSWTGVAADRAASEKVQAGL